jgi:hypothetical protein
MILKTLLFLAIGLLAIDSKPLPITIPWVSKIQDHLNVAPGGAISAQKPTSTTQNLTSSMLSQQGHTSWTGNVQEEGEQTIVIQKRSGTTEPLNKDKVCDL